MAASTIDQLTGTASPLAHQGRPSIWWRRHGSKPGVELFYTSLKLFEFYGLDQDKQAVATFEKAFHSPQSWAAFRRLAASYIQLDAWCAGFDAQLRAQSSWRSRLPAHRANGAAEMVFQEVRRVIGRRDWSLRNKYRTNQMLELIRVRINRQADPAVFARALRTHLETGVTP